MAIVGGIMTALLPAFLRTGSIGRLQLKNRLVRAPTSETMATASGESTDALVRLYGDLARGGAGLIITGHIYVEPCGQYEPMQLGLDRDDRIGPLRKMTDAVHREGGVVFAELSHAGSQSIIPEVQPIAPSTIPNAIFGHPPLEMTDSDVRRVIAAFGSAAARAKQAGFDGIHVHSGNGYLLSQFNSPYANRRTDQWGGDVQARSSFIRAVYRAVRDAVGPDLPITLRLGVADAIEGGLLLEDGLTIAKSLEAEGLDGLEISYGLMSSYTQNIRPYVGVTVLRGLMDGLVPTLFTRFVPEAYYRSFAKAAKAKLTLPLILVGGLRSTEVMDDIIRSGDADFLALARPFVREPDLVKQIIAGRRGPVSCVSCNLCFKHEGLDALRCWRTPAGILEHVIKFYVKPVFSPGRK
jgi:2,4-dienoyl-CoA reductase-like NADH-dependent reductase (Old Yellow Enzyme family)